jgi:predicted permease
MSLSMALLVAAGLFVRGAIAAAGATTGLMDAESTLLLEADASLGGYDESRSRQVYQRVGERLAGVPGVEAASIAATVPYGLVTLGRAVQRAGVHPAKGSRPATPAEGLAINSRWNSVGADYFTAFGVPLRRGRAFTTLETDHAGAPKVAVIDETLASRLWPDGDALGQRIQFANPDAEAAGSVSGGSVSASSGLRTADDDSTMEVVGIAASIRARLSKDQEAAVYVPFAQGFVSNVQFHIRTAGAPTAATLDGLRRAVREAAPGVPVFKVQTFRQLFENSGDYWLVKMGATLFSVFGGLALVLTTAGVYGVKAYAVARRTREIGIRIALGAEVASVRRMILLEGLTMAATGIGVGLLLGAGLSRILSNLLYDVSPLDPTTFALAPAVLFVAVMLACWVPARRATRVSPLTALRSE